MRLSDWVTQKEGPTLMDNQIANIYKRNFLWDILRNNTKTHLCIGELS